MHYNWQWDVFLQTASGHQTYLDWLLSGMWTTVQMGALGWILAFALGSILGILRTVPHRFARGIASTYVEVVRSVPLIVQLFLWYYLMPSLLPEGWRTWLFAEPPATTSFVTATLGLGFFTAARVCEQVRAGIDSLPRGQLNAALAMGLTLPQAYRYVLLPVAYRVIIPPMTSEMLSIFKNSSIAASVGVPELFARARQLNDYTARSYESFIAVIACYLLINAAVIALMTLVERRARVPGFMNAK
ncbi:MAG TPA: amino acid ABC transporter permease [Burkholderiales bacterium]|nr:amino acid ABC transporter permease [Burkholderiales bacterium]